MLRVGNYCIATADTDSEALDDWQRLTEDPDVLLSFLEHFGLAPAVYAPSIPMIEMPQDMASLNDSENADATLRVSAGAGALRTRYSFTIVGAASSAGGGASADEPQIVRFRQQSATAPLKSPGLAHSGRIGIDDDDDDDGDHDDGGDATNAAFSRTQAQQQQQQQQQQQRIAVQGAASSSSLEQLRDALRVKSMSVISNEWRSWCQLGTHTWTKCTIAISY